VVEVGLGGRLDATNVISPLACAITRLGYDHMEFLGDTLRSIAGEKAGIIKRGLPVVSAPQEWEALDVIADVARRVGAHLIIAERCTSPSLIGLHQEENAGVAATLAWATGLITDEAIIRAGIAQVRWPGRYETACAAPLVIIDGAHDPLAMSALVRTVAQDVRVAQPPHLVIGASSGHDPVGLWEPLRGIAWSSFVCTAADHPRALPPLQVARAARVGAVDVVAAVDDAVRLALVRAQQDGAPVIITGSLFVVGEARALFFDMPRDSVHPRF
jgi:dihydrofolate synthase/folylpolyglutamate synthase